MDVFNFLAEYWLEFLCSILTALLIKLYNVINKKLREFNKRQEIIENTNITILKERISKSHTYWSQRGYCPISALESIEMLYNQLKELEKSETYDNLIDELRHMRHYPAGINNNNNTNGSNNNNPLNPGGYISDNEYYREL